MKQLTLDLEDELSLLNKYRITPNELMFIRTLLILQDGDGENLFKSCIENLHDSKISVRDVLLYLQKKEIILKSYKIPNEGCPFDPYTIPFNKNFVKNLYKCSFDLGKELFDAYPQFTTINGNLVALRGVSKHFDSLEEAYFKYGKYIKWNSEVHEKIIDLVNWAKDKDIINCSLSSFIINNGWNDLEAMRNGDVVNINYDTVKLI